MPLSYSTSKELFQGISEQDLQKISRVSVERSYRKGTAIFSRGDPSDSLYIVKNGKVRMEFLSGKGTEAILHILNPGAIFGELLLSEERRALSAVAATDSTIIAIQKASLVELLASIPAMSRNFIRILSRRLAKVEKEFGDFSHTWSYHRLAQVLLRLCDEHGKVTSEGTEISLRLTHEDIANLIGTTRETVTTQLSRFRRMKLVSTQGRNIVVHRRRLEEFAGSVEMRSGFSGNGG